MKGLGWNWRTSSSSMFCNWTYILKGWSVGKRFNRCINSWVLSLQSISWESIPPFLLSFLFPVTPYHSYTNGVPTFGRFWYYKLLSTSKRFLYKFSQIRVFHLFSSLIDDPIAIRICFGEPSRHESVPKCYTRVFSELVPRMCIFSFLVP